MTKTCIRCNETKPATVEHFTMIKRGKDKVLTMEGMCRCCRNVWQAARVREKRKDPIQKAKESVYRKARIELTRPTRRAYYLANRERLKELAKKKHGTPEYREQQRLSHKRRWNNPVQRVSRTMSTKINHLIKDKQGASWKGFVPYTLKELMDHLERQFRPGMTWTNYGPVWHIDHVKPVSWFTFESKDDTQFKECWALSNLQPLFKGENLSKSDRYEGTPH